MALFSDRCIMSLTLMNEKLMVFKYFYLYFLFVDF
jgi:hypothetical protein